jgi:hypothetical protein
MNWKEKAKAAIQTTNSNVVEKQKIDIVGEAATVLDDIRFILDSAGIEVVNELDFTLDCLDEIERYSQLVKENAPSMLAQYERLIALFLGQYLTEVENAKWVVYSGANHTISPFVIKLNTPNKHLDVFLFCNNFAKKAKNLKGGNRSQALRNFVSNKEKLSFQ